MNTLLTAMTPQLVCWLPAFNPLVTMLTIGAYRRASAQSLLRLWNWWSWPWRGTATTTTNQVAPANQLHR
jgi:hypothetical protein